MAPDLPAWLEATATLGLVVLAWVKYLRDGPLDRTKKKHRRKRG